MTDQTKIDRERIDRARRKNEVRRVGRIILEMDLYRTLKEKSL